MLSSTTWSLYKTVNESDVNRRAQNNAACVPKIMQLGALKI